MKRLHVLTQLRPIIAIAMAIVSLLCMQVGAIGSASAQEPAPPIDANGAEGDAGTVLADATTPTPAIEPMDKDDAKFFLKEKDCTKCHSVVKTKKGPSYRKIAKKYEDDPEGMSKMYEQVTTGPEVELEDGSKEEHEILEEDPAVIRSLLQWILNL